MAKENLPEYFKRHEESRFEEYKEKYKDIMRMVRKDGILEVTCHTDGGPLKYDWRVHELWGMAWKDIGEDPENEVIILTGAGDKWMVGDPSIWKVPFRQWPPDAVLKMRMESQKLMENLVFGIDVPVIAAVNGPGVHVEFAIACDITLVTEDVNFWDPHFLGATSPGDGMGLALQKTMGIKRAAYYCYTGNKLDGKTAVELGIANECLPREKLLERAWELAEFMVARPRPIRSVTHAILMRPWKQALVEDQAMHGYAMSFGLLLNEKGQLEWLEEMKRLGKI